MIILVNGSEREVHSSLVDEMYRIRAKVFGERMGWDVDVVNGREKDRFDDCDPAYLISVNAWTGRVEGSLRLLQTTGPNMLRDVFPVLLGPGEFVESPTVWESSRFSIDPEMPRERGERGLSRVTAELLCGIVEVGLLAGLTYVVSVFDARMLRIFRTADCQADVIGTPTRIGKVTAYAGLFEITEATRHRIGLAGNQPSPVLQQLAPAERLRAA
jgi:acyl homoserine lactone synthase